MIKLRSELPSITNPVFIDGYSALGYDETNPDESPIVHLEGGAVNIGAGFRLEAGASGSTIRGLAINAFPGDGILLNSADDVVIQGCHIGIRGELLVAGNGDDGIHIIGDRNVVGQVFDPRAGFHGIRNVVSANGDNGIEVSGSGNVIAGNRIGTNPTGESAQLRLSFTGNHGFGVAIQSGGGNDVGSLQLNGDSVLSSGNLVSGNQAGGIRIAEDFHLVYGNHVGTDATGASAVPNWGPGIWVERGWGEIIRGNIIGGNAGNGIVLEGDFSEVQGNRIGTNADGADLGNGLHGISLDGDFSTVGGSRSEDTNVIGFNGWSGIAVRGGDFSSVLGNLIGTNAAGNDLGNQEAGIAIAWGDFTVIGGAGREEWNVIGFNRSGVVVFSGDFGTVSGNFIGTNAAGDDLGNDFAGVTVEERGGVHVGGGGSGAASVSERANVIAFNGTAGVEVLGKATIRGNSSFLNGGLAIDLLGDGRTPNDPGDGDNGPNRLQNFPELDPGKTRFNEGTGEVEVRYRVDSAVSPSVSPITVDFYLADADAEEGMTYLSTDVYEVEEVGAFRAVSFPAPGGIGMESLVATATDRSGNTSEFSDPVPLPEHTTALPAVIGLALLAFARTRTRGAILARGCSHDARFSQ
jgi:hypothetical protein